MSILWVHVDIGKLHATIIFMYVEINYRACMPIRQRNINWQDWKYTVFVVFVRYSQNIRRHNANRIYELVANVVGIIGLKLPFSSWFLIHFLLHRSYRFYYKKKSNKYKCVIIEYKALHRSISYWESLSCKIYLHSLRKHKWIKTQVWKVNFNPLFSTTSATS